MLCTKEVLLQFLNPDSEKNIAYTWGKSVTTWNLNKLSTAAQSMNI